MSYWASGYDWRGREAAVNALPSRFADIDGTPVHYLRYDGEHPDALPIVLTHGWPSTVLELTDLAERLVNPSCHGGRPEGAFTVIVPSLPGFAFSPQRPTLTGAEQTHDLWHRLMRDELGFERYAAHGRRPVPGRPEPAAPELGRAHVPRHALHAHAARRPLRRPRGTRPARRGHGRVLPRPPPPRGVTSLGAGRLAGERMP
ncbi:epoxide hydrolase N-terminal domain-containing protein [Streptomyces sp. NPDC021356]|uniref:epoxide hydrolase family protein n=1 Tax=Streptomyces sp. NPDC021356 TaxID=3154900 RepID=UPI0033F514D9